MGSRGAMPVGPDGPIERPELIARAVDLMTGGPTGYDDDGQPRYLSGAEAAREMARRDGISERHAVRYVSAARAQIAEQFAADLPARAAQLAAISMGVVLEARKDRVHAAVNGAVKNLCTIYGIDVKVAVKGDGLSALVEAIKTSPAARDDEIAALEAKDREGTHDGPESR
jgi:hypothetical protein